MDCGEGRCCRCTDGFYIGDGSMQIKNDDEHGQLFGSKPSIDFEGYAYHMPGAPCMLV